jgi:dephospho-CoA kinase
MISTVVGITGKSGCGKTTVCEIFKKNGFGVINSDLVAREVVEPNSQCLEKIVKEFSKKILNDDKSLNRKKLAEIVFNKKKKLEKLNKIIFPFILDRINEIIFELSKDYAYILLDAPTLFESGANSICSLTIGLIANQELILKRIIARDDITEQMAISRIKSQKDDEFFRKKCDIIISNNGSVEELTKKVECVILAITRKNGDLNV